MLALMFQRVWIQREKSWNNHVEQKKILDILLPEMRALQATDIQLQVLNL